MAQYIDKDTLVAEFNRLIAELVEKGEDTMFEQGRISAFEDVKLFLDTLEVKEVLTEQEGICNGIFNRIVGDNWNLSIPLDTVGLKHGNKVKIFIVKEK